MKLIIYIIAAIGPLVGLSSNIALKNWDAAEWAGVALFYAMAYAFVLIKLPRAKS